MKLGTLTWFTLVATGCVFAQDPPSRVARLNYLRGPVSFQPATVDDWTAATLNYPLTTGDHLYADQNASAEVGIGPNFIRIAHQTNFGFLNLDDRTVQIRLTEGSINIRVRALEDQDVWEVDTPNGAITLLRSGEYRIDTDPNRNSTMVTVRGGDAEITANGISFPVHARQTGFVAGDGQQQSIQDANPPDDFDNFASDRDRFENSVPPPQFVSQNMVGYEDLGQYGTWQAQSEYGPIWRPRVAAGWAPYHEGRWVWREPWGWTWVDEAPWGFAPFHYGRWAYVDGGWGWCPGPVVVARPVYAPALVAFVGGGASLSVGFGGSGIGVGWFPLGPREIYAPAYHVSPAYVRQVNITNVREINNVTINNIVVNRTVNNVYVNRNVPGAFAAVSRQDFVSARPVQRATQMNAEQFRSAQVVGFTPGYAPQRESVFGRAAAGTVARPQQAVFTRQVVARTPPPAAPVPFAARQQALQNNGGRPLAAEQLNSIRANQPATQQPAFRPANARNEGFGRNTPQPATPQALPQIAPRTAPPAAPQQPSQPQQPAREMTRPQDRPQDRFERRPPQTVAPQAPPQTQPQRPEPAPAENRGFGRNQQQQAAPREENRPTPPAPRVETRPAPRVEPPAEPRVERPAPAAAPENRGFGRNQQQQAAPREENRPTPPAPRVETRPAPRVEPRAEPRVERPAPAAAPENRGFGRQPAPAPEKPKEDKKPGEKEKK